MTTSLHSPGHSAAPPESAPSAAPTESALSADAPRLLTGPPTITLTADESQLCALLQDVVERIHRASPCSEPLELRIAGGWVRDKLLGLSSHDIDIAVDHMSGYELAQHVAEYLAEQGRETRSVAKIAMNPERSKHLETATTVVLGQMVDFVNLRSESYNAESRVPQVAYGTPLEDAMRRDITINALFYNIGRGTVEDWTQRGLEDLRAGLVRTPMEPQRTFEDDPLRVLRVVRFASRFGYSVDGPTSEAMGAEAVRRALDIKISRERVGAEVALMAAGPRPLVAIRLLVRHALYPAVFRAPDGLPAADILPADVAVRLTHEVLAMMGTPALMGRLPLELFGTREEARRVLALAAYLYPYHAARIADGRRQSSVAAALVVMRDALKMSNHDTDTTVALHMLAPLVAQTAARIHNAASTAVSRSHLGLEIRRAAKLWPLAVVFAGAVDMLSAEAEGGEGGGRGVVVERYAGYVERVAEVGVERAFEVKHLVDGRRAAQILGVRPGPVIRRVLERVMVWQLDNPQGTREQCEEFVRDEGLPSEPA
ncbi:CCA tRNA nucleotidyltransferase, mitochondrial [Coemansia interrupta]|uniref:CCA tRNA nucleotidyltransferase, mitochondrial n=1 Tax=Coemansia interrupta TaxID=1126814 RepID=A0A9W8H7K0_9FUNG|nr:CCA tRNA nucleotidyltransferase, mitochondrial [Coemansia interrupta]